MKHSRPTTTTTTAAAGGFSLVEIVIALGIAAFCLITIFGLLPVGLNTNQSSIQQTQAVGVAAAIVADLRATTKTTPPTAQTSPIFKVPIPVGGGGNATHTLFLTEDGVLPSGATADADADPAKNPRYRATLYFSPPSTASLRSATSVRVLLTWPALADAKAGTAPKNFAGSYEIVTALDRN